MRNLDLLETRSVTGCGALGSTIGRVVGGIVAAVACMAATAPTGGAAAVGAIGIVAAASRIGADIGSAIEDSL